MKTLILSSAAGLALLAAAPASAQLLGGGGGGLGGALGGGLGGGLGGMRGPDIGGATGPLRRIGDRPVADSDALGRADGAVRGQKRIDRRAGRVETSGDASGSGALGTTTGAMGRTTTSSFSGSGSASGAANAQLIGTDQLGGALRDSGGAARNGLARGREVAGDAAQRGRAAADRARGAATTSGDGAGTLGLSGSRNVDTRSGQVSGSGSASGSGMLDRTAAVGGRSVGGQMARSGSASGGGSAQLIGTDAIGSATRRTTGTASNAVARGREAAGAGVDRVRALNPGSAMGGASGSGAAAGSASYDDGAAAAASGSGAGGFNVVPGMPVNDARGHVIGRVQAVRRTASGALSAIVVRVGKRAATLPVNNFSANGELLVSAMGKGDIQQAASQQAAEQPASTDQRPN